MSKGPKRRAIKVLLVVCPIVFVCLVVWLIAAGGTSSSTSPVSSNSSSLADRVDVVYFHRIWRCYSCRYVEAGARYTVETHFADELAGGTLTFDVINVEDEANAEIVEKYGASYSSLFVNAVKDGVDHIEEATDTYLLIGRDEAFVTALKSRIERSLSGES
jgi:hypothetical protein